MIAQFSRTLTAKAIATISVLTAAAVLLPVQNAYSGYKWEEVSKNRNPLKWELKKIPCEKAAVEWEDCTECGGKERGDPSGDRSCTGSRGKCASSSPECVSLEIPFGQPTGETTEAVGSFYIKQEHPSAALFTPAALNFRSYFNHRIAEVQTEDLPSDVARKVTVQHGSGHRFSFSFPQDSQIGKPVDPGKIRNAPSRFWVDDPDDPSIYRWYGKSSGYAEFDAETHEQTAVVTSTGRRIETGKDGIDVIRTEEDTLRQVKAADGLADIVAINDMTYEIRFYSLDQVSDQPDPDTGLYTVDADNVQPYAVWHFENPKQDRDHVDHLYVEKTYMGETSTIDYYYTEASELWDMSLEGGKKYISRHAYWNDDRTERLIVREVRNEEDELASRTTKRRKQFPWGEEDVKITEKVSDDKKLVTRLQYYTNKEENGYGQVKSVVEPDGSWTMYDYDSEGRRTRVVRSSNDVAWSEVENLSVDEAVAKGRCTVYSYAPVDPADEPGVNNRRARTITRKIRGTVVSKTWHAYMTRDNGAKVEITERAASADAAYGDAANMRTVRIYYPSSADPAAAGRLHKVKYPDGRLDTYTYIHGTYDSNADPAQASFSANPNGADLKKTITHGTVDNPDGIANKTTREVTVTTASGEKPLQETYVYTGSGYERIDWTVKEYDEQGRVTATHYADGTSHQVTWGCCGKEYEKKRNGTEYYYTYDELDRVASKTKVVGDDAVPDITTSFSYDAEGNVIGKTRSAGTRNLTTSKEYDLAGRLTSSTNEAGLTTTREYSDGGSTVKVTQPGGGTRVTKRYNDGRIKSVTGSAVTNRYYEYGVSTDSSGRLQGRWTKVYKGEMPDSGDFTDIPNWTKTTKDALGRVVKTEKPTFDGGTAVTTRVYNDNGQLVKSTQSGKADRLYVYNALSERVRSGLDVDGDGTLDPAETDRINDSATVYEKDSDGDWWRKSVSKTYPTDNDSTALTTSVRKQRLTGFGEAIPQSVVDRISTNSPESFNVADAVLTAQSISEDRFGNETVSYTYTDPDSRTQCRVTDTPDSDENAVTVTVNGHTELRISDKGHATHYDYDALGRRIETTDPRISEYVNGEWENANITHYNDKGQVDYREDTAGNRTTFAYYSESGRRKWKENPLGKKTYFAYNDRGKVIRKWGDTPYPVEQVYDEHGRRIKLKTYRNGSGWDGSSWPSETGDADVTTWIYDDATGLLSRKEYDDGKGTDYTYDIAGRLKTRTWARTDENGDPIVTTYNYDPATGNLLSTDYSDDTQDITYTYTRMGQKKTVTDAAGKRTFDYNREMQRASETLPSDFYGDKVFTNKYEDSTGIKPGRDKGFKLGTSTDPDADMEITYGYDNKGRLNSVEDSNGTYNYTYADNTDMIATTTHPNGLKRTRAYESERNVVDYVQNDIEDTTVSKYDYINDAAGKRTDVERTGTAFSQSDQISYNYNDRSEVTGAESTADDNYDYSYAYDNIGNRRSSGNEVNSYLTWNRDYTANNLNQYESVNNELELSTRWWDRTFDWKTEPDHDADGNMTYMPSWTGNWELTWNAENRLIQAQSANTKLKFTYDYKGRRIRKQVYQRDTTTDDWSLHTDHRFIYNGWNLVYTTKTTYTVEAQAEIPMRRRRDRDPTHKTYTWGLDLSGQLQGAGGVGGLLAVTEHQASSVQNPFFTTYDANGNVSEYIDGSGNTVAHYEYSPFGRLTAATGDKAADFNHRFSTKYQSNETGLYYYGYRYYSAELGRWLNRDPIGEIGSLNLLAFVKNNAVLRSDALGLLDRKKTEKRMEKLLKAAKRAKDAKKIAETYDTVQNLVKAYNGDDKAAKKVAAKGKDKIMEQVKKLAIKVAGNSGRLSFHTLKPAVELYYKAGTAALSGGVKIVSHHKACLYCMYEEDCHKVGEVWKSKEKVTVTASHMASIGRLPWIEYHPTCKKTGDGGLKAYVFERGATSLKWIDCFEGKK